MANSEGVAVNLPSLTTALAPAVTAMPSACICIDLNMCFVCFHRLPLEENTSVLIYQEKHAVWTTTFMNILTNLANGRRGSSAGTGGSGRVHRWD